ncbi:AAA family ATPase [uncultured Shewanella sp.]|uniref:AAA family ATPase n=1 Tax=uncultured Shewanella sp. TaxID=173975 RepID=UPI00262DBB9E|nr:AAA family ATPase [uncultured Shewanella sp.]
MKRIMILGKPGSGKSTLSRRLARETQIPLHALDIIEYKKSGERIDQASYLEIHENIIAEESWIIEGLGLMESFFQRLEVADTVIYIDVPYLLSYWWVTKRFLKGLFIHPQGWPQGCSVVKGTWRSYKVLRLCPQFWNREFMEKLQGLSTCKSVYIIRSAHELNHFVEKEVAC